MARRQLLLVVNLLVSSLLPSVSGSSAIDGLTNTVEFVVLHNHQVVRQEPIREITGTTSRHCLVQCAGNRQCYGSEISFGSWRHANVTCRLFDRRSILKGALQLQEGFTYHKRSIHPTHKGIIRHDAGRCVGTNPQSSRIEVNDNCTEPFELINNRIYKQQRIHCLIPVSGNQNEGIMLTTNCEDPLSEFVYYSGDNEFYNTETSMCIHPNDGLSFPPSGSPLVIYSGCGMQKLRFHWEDY